MVDLSVYTARDLQTAKSLIVTARDAGIDIAALLAAIEGRVANLVVEVSRKLLCPSCGKGYLAPVGNLDGLTILGCRRCRFSRVEE